MYSSPPMTGPHSMAMFMATVLKAAPLFTRSLGRVSPTSDWATGIWKRRTTPMNRVMAKMCQTSSRSVRISASIRIPMRPMTNSTDTSSRLRGSLSAMAPANRARKFSAMRAAAMEPTRNGESVSERTNHPSTADSIWVPMPTSAVEPHTKAKLRCRKMPRGVAARVRVSVSLKQESCGGWLWRPLILAR